MIVNQRHEIQRFRASVIASCLVLLQDEPVKTILNTIIIGAIVLLLYSIVGHDFVKFYLGGQAEILETAANINKLCNDAGTCPAQLEGWQPQGDGGMLSNGNLLYLPLPIDGNDKGKTHQAFKLIYRFFLPEWFEVQGGVNRELTTEWISQ